MKKFNPELENLKMFQIIEISEEIKEKAFEFGKTGKKFIKFQRVDKKFSIKYPVFRDLREKGYIVKTALKFGADFRVYEKGKNQGESMQNGLFLLTAK